MPEPTPSSDLAAPASPPGKVRLLQPAAISMALVVATALQLRWQGRNLWCACGNWSLWSGDVLGSHNSQHLLDPYSFTHLLHGLLLFGLLAISLPRVPLLWRMAICTGIECGWEIFENSAFVISRYRAATAAVGYEGDSIANSMGDILSCACGFWLASRLGRWKSVALFVSIELVLLISIRDNFVLSVVMLLFPVDVVKSWQLGQ